jgi:hypothetical protein
LVKNIETVQLGNIYRVPINFVDTGGGKERPTAIIKLRNIQKGADGYAIYSSKAFWDCFDLIEKKFMYRPIDFQKAGLQSESYVNISNLEFFNYEILIKYMGKLSPKDFTQMDQKITAYSTWQNEILRNDPKSFVNYLQLRKAFFGIIGAIGFNEFSDYFKVYDLKVTDLELNEDKLKEYILNAPKKRFNR